MYFNNEIILQTSSYSYSYSSNLHNLIYQDMLYNIKNFNKNLYFLFEKNKIKFTNNFLKIKIKINFKKNLIFSNYIKTSLNTKNNNELKYFKLKKKTLNQPLSLILKNRRLLRYFFKYSKIKSNKLNNKLLLFYKYYRFYKNFNINNTLGLVLLNTGVISNLVDVFYFLKSKLIKINNKVISSFWYVIKPNDIISFNQILFFSKYYLYFKNFNSRWLKRKKKKNHNILKRYLNFNKNSINISKVVKRWLFVSGFINFKNSFYEIDYRIGLIYCFFNSYKNTLTLSFFNLYFNQFMILNLWYYNF